jgi:hypothetical protein
MTQSLPFDDVVPGAVLEQAKNGLVVAPDRIVELARYLRDEQGYDYCSMVTSIDWPQYFEVVYYLYGVAQPKKLSGCLNRASGKQIHPFQPWSFPTRTRHWNIFMQIIIPEPCIPLCVMWLPVHLTKSGN